MASQTPKAVTMKTLTEKDGSYRHIYYNENADVHRLDGPAHTWYRNDGSVLVEYYMVNGKAHRMNGGPSTIFYRDGQISSVDFRSCGLMHNALGPSAIYYWKDGTLRMEVYYLEGKSWATRFGGSGERPLFSREDIRDWDSKGNPLRDSASKQRALAEWALAQRAAGNDPTAFAKLQIIEESYAFFEQAVAQAEGPLAAGDA